jgi:hypothetical protein
VALAVASLAPAARAEPADLAPAQALFEQGRADMARGEYARACSELEESQRLAPALGTAFNLADCWTHTGRLAAAWSLFRDVEAEARLTHQNARAEIARKRADELEQRLPRLRIQVQSPADQIEVRRDGAVVGTAQWEAAVPVDLGDHLVSASAPGRTPWCQTVRVSKESETVSVVIPALAVGVRKDGALLPPPPKPPVTVGGAAPPLPRLAPSRVGPIALGAGGVALLVGSAVTLTVAAAMYRSAGPCSGTVCFTEAAVEQRQSARTLGNVATGLAIGGGAAVVASAVWWLVSERGDGRGAEHRAAWAVGLTPQAAVVLRSIW